MSFLASLESKIQDAPPAAAPKAAAQKEPELSDEEATEIDENPELETEEVEEETPDEEVEEEAPDEEVEEETPDEETEPGASLDDKAEYQVGDERVTGAELRKGYMRQADYTRKTQALADKAKASEARLVELEEENEEFKDWARGLKDPEDMRLELETHFPKTFAALVDAILTEAIDEHDMSDREKALSRTNRENANKERMRAKAADYEKRKAAKVEQAQKTNELSKTFNTWTDEVMAETGLDPKKAEHVDLLRAKVSTFRNTKWTKDTFLESAKTVAKALGVKPKAPKVDPKAGKKPEAKLPPVRSTGTKKPAKKPEAPPTKNKPTGTGGYFANLRKQAGIV